MPFDGLQLIATRFTTSHGLHLRQRPESLSALLESVGIEPVADVILDAHKTAEVKRHPANFFWRHPPLYMMLTLTCMWLLVLATTVTLILGTIRLGEPFHPFIALVWMGLSVVLLLTFLRLVLFTRALGPAYWVEKPIYHFADLPPAIREMAQHIRLQGDRSVSFAVGTLVQDEKILDPYLLVIKHDRRTGQFERACLGVWDGKTVLYLARHLARAHAHSG